MSSQGFERFEIEGTSLQLAVDSNRLGSSLASSIATPDIKAGELANKMNSLAQQQQVDQQTAAHIKPPAALTVQHRNLVESLQLRVDGLTGLARALRAGAGSTKVSETATNLASQTQYLVASDVLWNAKFRLPAITLLARDRITDIPVRASRFLTEQGVDSSTFWTPVVQRLNGNGTNGGNTSGQAVGTQLIGVTALPKNQQLSPTQLNTVVDTTNLGFAVQVKNSGPRSRGTPARPRPPNRPWEALTVSRSARSLWGRRHVVG